MRNDSIYPNSRIPTPNDTEIHCKIKFEIEVMQALKVHFVFSYRQKEHVDFPKTLEI